MPAPNSLPKALKISDLTTAEVHPAYRNPDLPEPVNQHLDQVQSAIEYYKNGGHDLKFDTPAKRQTLAAQLFEHLATGKTKTSFPHADVTTLNFLIEQYPEDIPPDMIRQAERMGEKFWQEVGEAGITGQIKSFSTAAWIFTMKNRYSWTDRIEQTHTVDEDLAARMARAEARAARKASDE